jgi:hypothetical protein
MIIKGEIWRKTKMREKMREREREMKNKRKKGTMKRGNTGRARPFKL